MPPPPPKTMLGAKKRKLAPNEYKRQKLIEAKALKYRVKRQYQKDLKDLGQLPKPRPSHEHNKVTKPSKKSRFSKPTSTSSASPNISKPLESKSKVKSESHAGRSEPAEHVKRAEPRPSKEDKLKMKQEKNELFKKRTKKGQIIMKDRIKALLDKIEK